MKKAWAAALRSEKCSLTIFALQPVQEPISFILVLHLLLPDNCSSVYKQQKYLEHFCNCWSYLLVYVIVVFSWTDKVILTGALNKHSCMNEWSCSTSEDGVALCSQYKRWDIMKVLIHIKSKVQSPKLITSSIQKFELKYSCFITNPLLLAQQNPAWLPNPKEWFNNDTAHYPTPPLQHSEPYSVQFTKASSTQLHRWLQQFIIVYLHGCYHEMSGRLCSGLLCDKCCLDKDKVSPRVWSISSAERPHLQFHHPEVICFCEAAVIEGEAGAAATQV